MGALHDIVDESLSDFYAFLGFGVPTKVLHLTDVDSWLVATSAMEATALRSLLFRIEDANPHLEGLTCKAGSDYFALNAPEADMIFLPKAKELAQYDGAKIQLESVTAKLAWHLVEREYGICDSASLFTAEVMGGRYIARKHGDTRRTAYSGTTSNMLVKTLGARYWCAAMEAVDSATARSFLQPEERSDLLRRLGQVNYTRVSNPVLPQ